MTFVKRQIELVLSYGTGDKGLGPPRVIKLTGHRASVSVSAAGGIGMGQMQARVYGIPLSGMNDLSTVGGLPTLFRKNTITVSAGDEPNVSQIFEGTIVAAWADMASAPSAPFNVTSAAGMIESLLQITPSSYRGPVDAALIMLDLAAKAGLKFENSGVSKILAKQYLPGAARDQMERCADAADFEWVIDNGVLAIWPRGGHRGGLIPLISPDTGMVGYPTYTSTGIIVTTIFNPQVRFGGLVQVKSSMIPANGKWRIVSLNHEVEAEMPGGKWFTRMQLAKPELIVVV